jgi:outer membrane protein OmpA-like peptidoglycan-associated protein
MGFSLVDSVARYFLGPDVFISYSRADAYTYAARLAAQLKGLYVYLDQLGSPPSRIVPSHVLKQARRSTVLVVLGSPEALRSSAVEQEISSFPSHRRPLIPVLFGDKIETALPWGERVAGLAVEHEALADLHRSTPSEKLIRRIRLAVGNQRQSQRLQRAGLLVAVLLALGLLALGFTLVQLRSANGALKEAQAEFTETKSRQAETEGALTNSQKELSEKQKKLVELQASIGQQEQRLLESQNRAAREERRANDQVTATAELWEALDTGIQDSYPQPDLSCKDELTLNPPLTIHFLWDQSSITDKARELLDDFAKCYLRKRMDVGLTIAGHSSEMTRQEEAEQGLARDVVSNFGTNEYNLSLGERRANAVREYLSSQGLPSGRVRTISYGEERQKYKVPLMDNRAELTFALE